MARNPRINKREIDKLFKGLQKEFDKHPIQIPVEADSPVWVTPDWTQPGTTNVYNGPVIHGDANGAQLAWNSETVQLTQSQVQIAPGFEAIAKAVEYTIKGLPGVGLKGQDECDAEEAAQEVLAEVTKPEPDQGKIKVSLDRLKGILAPVATGLSTGAGQKAAEWAKTAIQQLVEQF